MGNNEIFLKRFKIFTLKRLSKKMKRKLKIITNLNLG